MSVVDGGPATRTLIDRVKAILISPRTEWDVIAAEPATIETLYRRYILLLAAIGPVCGFIGGNFLSDATAKPNLIVSFFMMFVIYALYLAMVALLSLSIEYLASVFDGEKSRIAAFKTVTYSLTPYWIGGVFGLIPDWSDVFLVLGGVYGLYLLYLGLPKLMKSPDDKTVTYTIVSAGAAVVVGFAIGAIATNIKSSADAPFTFAHNRSAERVTIGGRTIDVGKLEQSAKEMEAAANRMAEAAGASGSDGGAGVTAVAPEALKAVLPAGLAGMPRTDLSASSGGVAGLSGSSAQGVYERGDARITLSVTDMSGAGAVAGALSAFGVQSTTENADGYEKVGVVDGRMTNEKYNRMTRAGEFGVVVSNRFMIQAEGQNVDMAALKAAVNGVPTEGLVRLARANR